MQKKVLESIRRLQPQPAESVAINRPFPESANRLVSSIRGDWCQKTQIDGPLRLTFSSPANTGLQ